MEIIFALIIVFLYLAVKFVIYLFKKNNQIAEQNDEIKTITLSEHREKIEELKLIIMTNNVFETLGTSIDMMVICMIDITTINIASWEKINDNVRQKFKEQAKAEFMTIEKIQQANHELSKNINSEKFKKTCTIVNINIEEVKMYYTKLNMLYLEISDINQAILSAWYRNIKDEKELYNEKNNAEKIVNDLGIIKDRFIEYTNKFLQKILEL